MGRPSSFLLPIKPNYLNLHITCNGPKDFENGADVVAAFLSVKKYGTFGLGL